MDKSIVSEEKCICENCGEEIEEEDAVEMDNGETWCVDCYSGYIDYAEYMYEE